MLLLAAAALAAAPQPQVFIFPQAVQPPVSRAKCKNAQAFVAGDSRYDGKRSAVRKLTELPPADVYLAVLRHDENGCGAPIIVKYNLGR